MIHSRHLAWSGLLVLALLATGAILPNAVAQPAEEGYEDADSGPGGADLRDAQQEFEQIITPEYRRLGMRVESLPDGSLRLRLPSEVMFAYDSADISRDFAPTLREVARLMKRHRGVRARIIGHTDNQGSQSYNLDLSLRRAESVALFLSAQGVRNRRLITLGRGEEEPIASNATPQGRQMNRRVDIVLFRRARGERPGRN
jgi:outer membrane protein OmpA-like peptidoglycan-associated protein